MSDPRIPVTLVTGFLGSGKTTLLANILRRPEFERTAVLINEFGEVPLDQALIDRTDGHVVVMSGGCLCCAITGDVVATLLDLHERRAALPFDRVIIETSGLADPGPILAPLVQAPELVELFRVDGVVAVVDALQGARELGRQRVSARQVAMADRIVLSKSDIAAPHAVEKLKTLLAELNPWAPLIVANHGAVEPGWLFGHFPPPPQLDHAPHHGNGHHHGHEHHRIRSFCLWLDRPIHGEAFAQAVTALQEEHGEKVLRIKGLLALDGESRPAAIHGVQHFLHPPAALGAWPDADRRSRVVFILDGLEEAAVRPFFASFTG